MFLPKLSALILSLHSSTLYFMGTCHGACLHFHDIVYPLEFYTPRHIPHRYILIFSHIFWFILTLFQFWSFLRLSHTFNYNFNDVFVIGLVVYALNVGPLEINTGGIHIQDHLVKIGELVSKSSLMVPKICIVVPTFTSNTFHSSWAYLMSFTH